MPCYRPLKAWRSSELTSTGKNRILFKPDYAHSTNPIQLPCGSCIGCRLDRSLSWAIRCTNEIQSHEQNSFITLTYSEEHLPQTGTLIPWHITDFLKRIRKQYASRTLRYYMCGEYGEQLNRPHYHICLFGLDFPDKEIFEEKEGILTFTSEILEKLWGKGFCTIGELNFETAAYTARYIAKKITGEKAHDHYTTTCPVTGQIHHLEPEYNRMSLRPGIGKNWLEEYSNDVYPSDFLIYKGQKIKTPRYYDKLHEIRGGDIEEIKEKRKVRAKRMSENNTPERLAVREKIKHINYKQLKRRFENET